MSKPLKPKSPKPLKPQDIVILLKMLSLTDGRVMSQNEQAILLFYEMLVLVDAIRSGRVRERDMAIKLLRERIHDKKEA